MDSQGDESTRPDEDTQNTEDGSYEPSGEPSGAQSLKQVWPTLCVSEAACMPASCALRSLKVAQPFGRMQQRSLGNESFGTPHGDSEWCLYHGLS